MPVPGLRPLVTVAKLFSASSVPDYCAVGGPSPNYAARSRAPVYRDLLLPGLCLPRPISL